MLFDEVIDKRYSERKYSSKEPSDESIEKLLEAARKAPIANGQYDKCRLTVVKDKNLMEDFVKEYQEKTGKSKNPLYAAPVFIIFSSSKDTSARFEDAGCVIEHICLKATEMGLGSCYIRGSVNALGKDAAYIKNLNLDEGFYPVSGVIVGYPDGESSAREHNIKTNYINWEAI